MELKCYLENERKWDKRVEMLLNKLGKLFVNLNLNIGTA